MSWTDTRSDIDIQISRCYSMIEELQNRIKELEAMKKSENRIDDLVKQLHEFHETETINTCKYNEKEFIEHFCHNCGSQRCEGVGTEWFDGCQYKECLKDYENFYG